MTAHSPTEEKIFRAALVEFAEQGKNGARMNDIAVRAGINKALVHYYFRSKDKLYQGVLQFIIAHFIKSIGEAIGKETRFDKMLRHFIHAYVDLVSANPLIPRFMLRELSCGAPALYEIVRGILKESGKTPVQMFLARIDEASASGEISTVDPAQTLITVMGACLFAFIAHPLVSILTAGSQQAHETFIENRKEHIFAILYFGLKPRKGQRS